MQFGCTFLAAGAHVGCVAFVGGLIDRAALEWCEHGHWAGGPRRPTSHSEIKAPPSVRVYVVERNEKFTIFREYAASHSAKLSFEIKANGDGTLGFCHFGFAGVESGHCHVFG